MKNFPSSLNVNNKENFDKLCYNRFLSYLRKDVYEHIINNEEHNYFDIEKFDKNHYKNMEKSIQIVEIIMKELWNAIYDYINNLGFSWFTGWNGYTSIRFNKYEKDKKMAEHCDHIQSIFDGNLKGIPILSVLGILNDDYKGGEFIMFKDKKINLLKGDLLIFPSIFLYPHKVEPIKKGTRYSFISWVY